MTRRLLALTSIECQLYKGALALSRRGVPTAGQCAPIGQQIAFDLAQGRLSPAEAGVRNEILGWSARGYRAATVAVSGVGDLLLSGGCDKSLRFSSPQAVSPCQ